MILSVEAKGDIRRLHDLWVARLAFEYRVEQTDIRSAIETPRADAPGAETVPPPLGVQSAAAGPAAVESPATLSPETAHELQKAAGETIPADQPSARPEGSPEIGGNPEATHSPERATETAATPPPAEEGGQEPPCFEPSSAPIQDQLSGRFDGPDASDPLYTGKDAAGEVPSSSPAPKLTLFERVKAVHAEHLDWDARQIATHIGRPFNSVQTTLAVVRKAVVAADQPTSVKIKGPDGSLKDRVRFVHQRYPSLTASLIAKELGANASSVSVYLAELRREEGAHSPVPAPPPPPEFASEGAMLAHYEDVVRRLGKPT